MPKTIAINNSIACAITRLIFLAIAYFLQDLGFFLGPGELPSLGPCLLPVFLFLVAIMLSFLLSRC
jgi:hypothetical protein